MLKIDKTTFQTLLEGNIPLLVIFGPSWHPMTTEYQSLIDDYGFNSDILKTGFVDLDELPEFINRFGLRVAPAVIFFMDGQVQATTFVLGVIQNISSWIGEDLYARARINNS